MRYFDQIDDMIISVYPDSLPVIPPEVSPVFENSMFLGGPVITGWVGRDKKNIFFPKMILFPVRES